jgi:hypothetical protein
MIIATDTGHNGLEPGVIQGVEAKLGDVQSKLQSIEALLDKTT